MTSKIIEKVEQAYIKKDAPEFRVGDTVSVSVRIVEGQKERTQVFTGTVISRKGRGLNEMFTVRRIVANEGVERVFPVNSPQILDVKVVRSGHTRRAKLYYLRDRIGKATRIKGRVIHHRAASKKTPAAAKASAEEAPAEETAKDEKAAE